MVQKGRSTVYVDLDQAERVTQNTGIRLSELTSQALEIADSEVFGDLAVGLRIKLTEDLIAETEDELTRLQRREAVLQKRLQENRDKIVTIQEEWNKVKTSVMLSRQVYQLNQVIIAGHYDIPTIQVSGAEYVEGIKKLSPLWELEVHVKAFKKQMDKL